MPPEDGGACGSHVRPHQDIPHCLARGLYAACHLNCALSLGLCLFIPPCLCHIPYKLHALLQSRSTVSQLRGSHACMVGHGPTASGQEAGCAPSVWAHRMLAAQNPGSRLHWCMGLHSCENGRVLGSDDGGVLGWHSAIHISRDFVELIITLKGLGCCVGFNGRCSRLNIGPRPSESST